MKDVFQLVVSRFFPCGSGLRFQSLALTGSTVFPLLLLIIPGVLKRSRPYTVPVRADGPAGFSVFAGL